MANYNKKYITYGDYAIMQLHGLQYEGFIEGVGYAYTSDIAIAPDHMSGNGSPFSEPGLDQYMQGTVQWIDTSKEAIARSYNITEEEIKRKIAKANEKFGVVTVNLGFNRSVDLPLHDNVIDVRINSDGTEQIVSIELTNKLTGKNYYAQHKMVDLPLVYEKSGFLDDFSGDISVGEGGDNSYLGLSLTGIGAVTGASEYRLAKKLDRFRPIRDNNASFFRKGTIAINQESRALMTGSRYLQGLRTTLYWTGIGAATAGIICSYIDYQQGNISGQKLTMDIVMTGIGFVGPIGLGISTFYFIALQPIEHHPTPDFILNPMSDYNQSARIDNTRVYNPYNY